MLAQILYLNRSTIQVQSKVTVESPVAQWLERPTRSRRVVGSNPIWNSDFFPSLLSMQKLHVVFL